VIFIRLPRGPVPRPDRLLPRTGSVIRDLASRPGVLMADEHAFDSLERPEFFWDALHLNRAGIARFSPMLAEEISRLLAR
jgi:lysophospholipase L1-like esterase